MKSLLKFEKKHKIMKGVILLGCIFMIIDAIRCEEAFVVANVHGFKQTGNFIFGHELCARNHMSLPMPLTDKENQEFIDFMKANQIERAWLGGSDYGIETQFRWITTALPVQKFFWHQAQPDNYANSEDCIEMWKIGEKYAWNDINCKNKFTIVCQRLSESNYNIDVRINEKLGVKAV